MRALGQRERTCPVVSLGSGTPVSTLLSIQLKWTNHIDCLWAGLQPLIWLGGLPGTQALRTHHGDRLDFKPAQDARKFVGCRVRSPLNPHVLLRKMTQNQRASKGTSAEMTKALQTHRFPAVSVPNHNEKSLETVVAWLRVRWRNSIAARGWRWASGKEVSHLKTPQIRWNSNNDSKPHLNVFISINIPI